MKHIQRFTVRMIGDRRWTDTRRFSVGHILGKALEAEWTSGRLIPANMQPFALTAVNVFAANPPTPRDGAKARREGFLFEDNPYAPGSRRYEAWARAYVEASTFTHHYGPSPVDQD